MTIGFTTVNVGFTTGKVGCISGKLTKSSNVAGAVFAGRVFVVTVVFAVTTVFEITVGGVDKMSVASGIGDAIGIERVADIGFEILDIIEEVESVSLKQTKQFLIKNKKTFNWKGVKWRGSKKVT